MRSGTYGWIWRSIRHLTVGSRGKAVQHAKLWLLHWGAEDEDGVEYLELVVSSANLTRAAFKGQLQAAWRACIELRPQRSEARLDRWGDFCLDFLRELAASAGDDGRLTPVRRAPRAGIARKAFHVRRQRPGNALASGCCSAARHGALPAFGDCAFGPGYGQRCRFSVLSSGRGSADALRRWCAPFEGSPNRLALVWIDKNHPWARARAVATAGSHIENARRAGRHAAHLRHAPDDSEDRPFP